MATRKTRSAWASSKGATTRSVSSHGEPTAFAKSGVHTVGAARQWLGSCGKVDNGVVGVHFSYCAPGFQCLLDSELYLPKEWADDPVRRKKATSPTRSCSAPSRRSPWRWWLAP